MHFLYIFVLLANAREVLSTLTASNAPLNVSNLLASPPSNATISATGSNPLQRPKSFHVPNSPVTLVFIVYAAAPTLHPTIVFQTLITALNSVFHATLFNHGDGLVHTDTLSWSVGGATLVIENHGYDHTGQVTWGVLADTFYGVGAFFEQEACWCGEWIIEVERLGHIGSGSIGARDYDELESPRAGTAVSTA